MEIPEMKDEKLIEIKKEELIPTFTHSEAMNTAQDMLAGLIVVCCIFYSNTLIATKITD